MQQPPNLLVLMADHQRADSLGMTQAGIEVTPALNRLAANAVVFERAYTTCPLCVPARTALATGLYPTRNGVITNDWAGATAGDFTPIHERLARAGYDVAHIGVDHIRVKPGLRERLPLARWIDPSSHAAYLADRHLAELDHRGLAAFRRPVSAREGDTRVERSYSNTTVARWEHPAEHFKDLYFCREAIEFLRAPRPRPFALFLYLWAPHPPLRVPEPYYSMFDPARLDLPANVGVVPPGEPASRRRGVPAQLAEGIGMDQWRRVWAAHLGLVRLVDDGLGAVLRALEESGAADRTATLFTVDHGDHLGQRLMYQKFELYEQAVRIPMVLRAPGLAPRRVAEPVSHLDIVPTLTHALGMPAPAGLDGRDLWPALRAGEPIPDNPVFIQYSGNDRVGDLRRAVVTRRFKYVHEPGEQPELFDLEHDPLEMTNLAAVPALASVRQSLHAAGAEWARTHGDRVAW